MLAVLRLAQMPGQLVPGRKAEVSLSFKQSKFADKDEERRTEAVPAESSFRSGQLRPNFVLAYAG